MAEIGIEKKKPVWPWVLLALLIIGVIAVFFWPDDDDGSEDNTEEMYQDEELGSDEMDDKERSAMENADDGGALAIFANHIDNEQGRMGLDHEYTHRAFTLLSDAIHQVADERDYDIQADLDNLDTWADQLKVDPQSLKHADLIKKGFERAIAILDGMQKAEFPDQSNELEPLRKHSNEMRAGVPTLEQKSTVKGFFDAAANLLNDWQPANN